MKDPKDTTLVEMPAELPSPKMFYSAQERGFFSSEIHDRMPPDVLEITHELWMSLLADQMNGKRIVPGPDGRPIAIDFVETPEMKRRDVLAKLSRLDAQTLRALRENALNIAPEPGQPTAAERLAALNAQMDALRAELKSIS